MKKLLILQIEDKALGGVWYVNKTLSEELLKHKYEVRIASIRERHDGPLLDINPKVTMTTINPVDKWQIIHRHDIIDAIKTFNIKNIIDTTKQYFSDNKKLNEDYNKLQEYVEDYNPDYIIASHYQVLPGIPESYLDKTINIHHSAYDTLNIFKDNKKKLIALKDKLKLVWLTKSSYNSAIKDGFKNSTYIYNPIKFSTSNKADVVKNKKLVTITRLGEEKRIELMVELVEEVFKDKKYKDWTFEIYGFGPCEQSIKDTIKNKKQVKFMGKTDDAMNVLLSSSINLNTSLFEGFNLSILESYECGLPTVTFNFGESAYEEIDNESTGFIVEQNNKEEYINKLKTLLDNEELLTEMSNNSKEKAKNFKIENIVHDWIKLFEEIDKD